MRGAWRKAHGAECRECGVAHFLRCAPCSLRYANAIKTKLLKNENEDDFGTKENPKRLPNTIWE